MTQYGGEMAERHDTIKLACWSSFCVAVCCSLVEAVADPDAWGWTAVRAVIGAVWLVLLVALVAVWFARRRD